MSECINPILARGEFLITVSQAAHKYGVNPVTVVRWIQGGCSSKAGHRVKLEGVRLGYKWSTSAEAMVRFFDLLSLTEPIAEIVKPKANTKSVEAATREMIAQGA